MCMCFLFQYLLWKSQSCLCHCLCCVLVNSLDLCLHWLLVCCTKQIFSQFSKYIPFCFFKNHLICVPGGNFQMCLRFYLFAWYTPSLSLSKLSVISQETVAGFSFFHPSPKEFSISGLVDLWVCLFCWWWGWLIVTLWNYSRSWMWHPWQVCVHSRRDFVLSFAPLTFSSICPFMS